MAIPLWFLVSQLAMLGKVHHVLCLLADVLKFICYMMTLTVINVALALEL